MNDPFESKTDMRFAYAEPSEMADGVSRLVAPNPSAFTFKGTNTYLIGGRALAVIDPGPDDPAHIAAIIQAAAGRPITHILYTHTHRDHVDAVATLKRETGALVCGFVSSAVRGSAESSPSGADFVNASITPDLVLRDEGTVSGADWALEAIHTPGHAPDHLCFALRQSPVLFSGDHVMAWNTSVIAPPEGHMGDYLRSLTKLLPRPETLYLPGHGGRITETARTVKAYLLHRKWREQAIMDAIRKGNSTIRTIVPVVYRDLADDLLPAARLSVEAHVEHLIERGLVAPADPRSPDARLCAC